VNAKNRSIEVVNGERMAILISKVRSLFDRKAYLMRLHSLLKKRRVNSRIYTGGISSEDHGQQLYGKKHGSVLNGWDITG
jgi:hypothetical protein